MARDPKLSLKCKSSLKPFLQRSLRLSAQKIIDFLLIFFDDKPTKFIQSKFKFFLANRHLLRVIKKMQKLPSTRDATLRIEGLGSFPDFNYFSPREDDLQLYARVNFLDWEYRTLKFVSCWAKGSRGMIDVGAYTGVYTIIAGLSNPDLRIYSFEPNPLLSSVIQKNLALNGLQDRTVFKPYAAGSKNSVVDLNLPKWNLMSAMGTTSNIDGFVRQINVVCLDTEVEVGHIDLIKIDVEGAETDVLNGASNLIMASRPVIVTEVLSSESYIAQWKVLSRFNYEQGITVSTTGADSRNYIWATRENYAKIKLLLGNIF